MHAARTHIVPLIIHRWRSRRQTCIPYQVRPSLMTAQSPRPMSPKISSLIEQMALPSLAAVQSVVSGSDDDCTNVPGDALAVVSLFGAFPGQLMRRKIIIKKVYYLQRSSRGLSPLGRRLEKLLQKLSVEPLSQSVFLVEIYT